MPLYIDPNLAASGSLPGEWQPIKGRVLRYPVRNGAVREHRRQLSPGRRQKVIKQGTIGKAHYFEHESGQVAGVKSFPREIK